jgi:D-serine deaminase-like pyridoxal phosphate-dependent protein
MNINKPVLLIDEGKCRANIQRMASLCAEKKMSFRPHFKTHQSLAVGKWFKELGVSKIAVSSLSMADYFSKEWNDILVAFPTNVLEHELINNLAQRIHLNLLVESLETINILADVVKFPLTIYVEIDTGYYRTGVYFDDYKSIDGILEVIENSECLSFGGFITHSGHSYDCSSQ